MGRATLEGVAIAAAIGFFVARNAGRMSLLVGMGWQWLSNWWMGSSPVKEQVITTSHVG